LKDGHYDITADGKPVMSATAVELAAGVNLGLAAQGPVYDQGMKIFQAITQKNAKVANRFNTVHRFNPPTWLKIPDLDMQKKAELERLLKVIDTANNAIAAAAEPTPHAWAITPAK